MDKATVAIRLNNGIMCTAHFLGSRETLITQIDRVLSNYSNSVEVVFEDGSKKFINTAIIEYYAITLT